MCTSLTFEFLHRTLFNFLYTIALTQATRYQLCKQSTTLLFPVCWNIFTTVKLVKPTKQSSSPAEASSQGLSTNNSLIPLYCWNGEFNTSRSFVRNLGPNCVPEIGTRIAVKLSCKWPATTWTRDLKTDPVFQLISRMSEISHVYVPVDLVWDHVLAITIS